MKHNVKLLLHIGLHKTGTTSFQIACSQSREKLQRHGICYPEAPSFTGNTAQHLLLPSLFREPDGCDRFIDILNTAIDFKNTRMVLLSAEDLSTFFSQVECRYDAEAVIKCFNNNFIDWSVYVVVREGPAMLKSLILQNIESSGYPRNTSLQQIAYETISYLQNLCQNLKSLFGSRISGIDYNTLIKSYYCSKLLQNISGIDIQLDEVFANSSSRKSLITLLSSDLRSLWSDLLNSKNRYHHDVNIAVNKTISCISIKEEEEIKFLNLLTSKIDLFVNKAVNETQSAGNLLHIING